MEVIFLVVGVGQLPQEQGSLRRFGKGGGIAAQRRHPHPDDAFGVDARHEPRMKAAVSFILHGK